MKAFLWRNLCWFSALYKLSLRALMLSRGTKYSESTNIHFICSFVSRAAIKKNKNSSQNKINYTKLDCVRVCGFDECTAPNCTTTMICLQCMREKQFSTFTYTHGDQLRKSIIAWQNTPKVYVFKFSVLSTSILAVYWMMNHCVLSSYIFFHYINYKWRKKNVLQFFICIVLYSKIQLHFCSWMISITFFWCSSDQIKIIQSHPFNVLSSVNRTWFATTEKNDTKYLCQAYPFMCKYTIYAYIHTYMRHGLTWHFCWQ